MKRDWNIRTIYLYLVSFVTLMMLIFGSVNVIKATVSMAYPPPTYYPGPMEVKMRTDDKQPLAVVEEQVRLERERQEQQVRYDNARRVAESLSLLLVALPIYLYHWKRIRLDSGEPPRTA